MERPGLFPYAYISDDVVNQLTNQVTESAETDGGPLAGDMSHGERVISLKRHGDRLIIWPIISGISLTTKLRHQ